MLVSFPAEELVDWISWRNGSLEGGFTLTVIEEAFGRPAGSSGESPDQGYISEALNPPAPSAR